MKRSGDPVERVHKEIAYVLTNYKQNWEAIKEGKIDRFRQLAIVICNWAGYADLQLNVAAWTDTGRARLECIVSGVWMEDNKRSILPNEVRSSVPGWSRQVVSVQPDPNYKIRLTTAGLLAGRALRRSRYDRQLVLFEAVTTRLAGRVQVRVISSRSIRRGSAAPLKSDGTEVLIKEGFDGVTSMLSSLAASQKASFVELKSDLSAPQVVSGGEAVSFAKISKSSFEKALSAGKLPRPDFPGGNGKAHKWLWANLRPQLQKIANRPLPGRFPSDKFIS